MSLSSFKCKQCGLEFEHPRKKTYCSLACRRVVQMQNQYRWIAENPERNHVFQLRNYEKRKAKRAVSRAAREPVKRTRHPKKVVVAPLEVIQELETISQ